MKKFLALVMAAMMALSCAAALAEDEAGFPEYDIGPEMDNERQVEFFNVSMVYFQPVDMEPVGDSLPRDQANLHIEADLSALENDLGYEVGSWIPYMQIDYVIKNENGDVVAEGKFMPMAATDGPHYGANIYLPDAGLLSVTLTFHSPAENGYLLHVDEQTGVTGRFWTEPVTSTWENWEYVPQTW